MSETALPVAPSPGPKQTINRQGRLCLSLSRTRGSLSSALRSVSRKPLALAALRSLRPALRRARPAEAVTAPTPRQPERPRPPARPGSPACGCPHLARLFFQHCDSYQVGGHSATSGGHFWLSHLRTCCWHLVSEGQGHRMPPCGARDSPRDDGSLVLRPQARLRLPGALGSSWPVGITLTPSGPCSEASRPAPGRRAPPDACSHPPAPPHGKAMCQDSAGVLPWI